MIRALKNQHKRLLFRAPRTLYQLRCHGKGKLIGFLVSITGLL